MYTFYYKYSFNLILLLFPFLVFGQKKVSTNQTNDKTLLLIEKSDSLYSLKNNVKVFYDYSKSLKINDISNNIFEPINDTNLHERAPINWYTFQIYPTIDAKFVTITFRYIDLVELYIPYNKRYRKELVGLFTKKKIKQNRKEKLRIILETDSIDFSKPFYYAAHLLSLYSSDLSKELPSVAFSNYDPTQNFLLDNVAIGNALFLSVLTICFVIIIIMYIMSKNINFLTYGLYLFAILLMYSHRIPFLYNFYNDIHPKFARILNGTSHYLASMLYSYFIIIFIKIKEKSKQLYTLSIAMIIAFFVFAPCITLFSIYKPIYVDTISFLVKTFEIIIDTTGVYILIRLMRMKLNIVEKLVIFGCVVLVSGNIVTMLTKNSLFFRWTAIVETVFFFGLISYQNMLNDRRRLEIQETLANEKRDKQIIEKLNLAKNQFYTNITHEFRTPLTVILGMAEALKDTVKSKKFDATEKSLEMIKRNGNNLLQLINKILDISKIESGNMEVHLTQSNSITFVKYVAESFHPLAKKNKINLTVYSEIDELIMDYDANKLASIISNLLSNAIKFTLEYGKIIVHINKITMDDKAYLFIKVQDNGIGITQADLPNIFKRFYQAGGSISRKNEGTGIGLALTKELVELLEGSINVTSIPQKGTAFTVKFPITNAAILEEESKISSILNQPLKPLSTETIVEEDSNTKGLPLVLIIEDNHDVAHYLKICLQDHYQTIHAVDGTIGIDLANQKIPDIIISDVIMPNKSGYEVCEILKTNELTSHIPIILLTAKTTIDDRITGLSHGADAYLTKPFVKEELFIRLKQLIALRQKMLAKFGNSNLHQLVYQKVENPDEKFLKKVITIIYDNLASQTFNTAMLAHKLSLSESQVYRKLKAISNKSTAVFIRSIRLEKGKELIETTNKNISEIAYDIGFNDPSWFTRAFKKEFGLTPNAMRK